MCQTRGRPLQDQGRLRDPLHRQFYVYTPPRPVEEIAQEIKDLDLVLEIDATRGQLPAESCGETMPSLSEGNLLSLRVPALDEEEQWGRVRAGLSSVAWATSWPPWVVTRPVWSPGLAGRDWWYGSRWTSTTSSCR